MNDKEDYQSDDLSKHDHFFLLKKNNNKVLSLKFAEEDKTLKSFLCHLSSRR